MRTLAEASRRTPHAIIDSSAQQSAPKVADRAERCLRVIAGRIEQRIWIRCKGTDSLPSRVKEVRRIKVAGQDRVRRCLSTDPVEQSRESMPVLCVIRSR